MKQEKKRTLLMESAMHIVARDGLENTTTKSIGANAGLNEVYIYRNFKDKEDLIRQTFLHEDSTFIREIINRLPVLAVEDMNWEMRCRILWENCWNYMMQRREESLFYVRYYYSASFDADVQKEHKYYCEELAEEWTRIGAGNLSETVLLYMIEMIWNYSAKVALGIWENDPETSEQCFQYLYALLQK